MNLTLFASLSAAGLFLGMLICLELGRRLGIARLARDPEGIQKGFGVIDGAVFALLGLLLAFTFSGAATRFDDRRHLMADEANAVGTAYRRTDLLPSGAQAEMRALFGSYVDSRLEACRSAAGTVAAERALARSAALQDQIWAKSLSACGRPEVASNVTVLVIPALNAMFDITTNQLVAASTHPPLIIFLLVGALSLVAALLAGWEMAAHKIRSWFHTLAFAGTISLAVYVIVDIEYPRLGLIRIDAGDQVLIDLRKSMQ